MKKPIVFALIFASSLFLSACTGPKNSSPADSDKSDTLNPQSQETFSLRDLIAKNIPQKCTYSGQNQEGNFDSEIIIQGHKFKQTINSHTSEGKIQLHTISDGEYFYSWGAGPNPKSGLKIKADFATPTDTNSDFDKLKTNQADLDTAYQGSCSPTVVSESDFSLPPDIVFQDYTEFLEKIQSNFHNPGN